MAKLHNEQSFKDLEETFKEYMDKADRPLEILQAGADAFVKDLKALPSPRSRINKAGYTHMIDTFASRQEGEDVLVGWGKYYGPIIERGYKTKRRMVPARPHFKPTFEKNKNRYYDMMIQKIHGGI